MLSSGAIMDNAILKTDPTGSHQLQSVRGFLLVNVKGSAALLLSLLPFPVEELLFYLVVEMCRPQISRIFL